VESGHVLAVGHSQSAMLSIKLTLAEAPGPWLPKGARMIEKAPAKVARGVHGSEPPLSPTGDRGCSTSSGGPKGVG
jgi:hypothetical protein